MNCEKCGNQLTPGEKFCRVCGELVQGQNNTVNQQSVTNTYPNNNMNVQQGYMNQSQSNINPINIQQPVINPSNLNKNFNNNGAQFKKSNEEKKFFDMNKPSSFTKIFFILCLAMFLLNIIFQAAGLYTSDSNTYLYIFTSSIIFGCCTVISILANSFIKASKVQIDIQTQDDQLVMSYIGDSNQKNNVLIYNNVKSKKINFNFFAFLLGPVYFVYRKLYIEALLIVIINVLFIVVSSLTLWQVPVDFILGFVFYPLYRRHIYKDVEQIKKETTYFENQKTKCRAKGSVNTGITALIFIIYILGMNFIIVSLLGDKYYNSKNFTLKYTRPWKVSKKISELNLCLNDEVLITDNKMICIYSDEVVVDDTEYDDIEEQFLSVLNIMDPSANFVIKQKFNKTNDYYVAKFEGVSDSIYERVYLLLKKNSLNANAVGIWTINKENNDFDSIEQIINTIKFK